MVPQYSFLLNLLYYDILLFFIDIWYFLLTSLYHRWGSSSFTLHAHPPKNLSVSSVINAYIDFVIRIPCKVVYNDYSSFFFIPKAHTCFLKYILTREIFISYCFIEFSLIWLITIVSFMCQQFIQLNFLFFWLLWSLLFPFFICLCS